MQMLRMMMAASETYRVRMMLASSAMGHAPADDADAEDDDADASDGPAIESFTEEFPGEYGAEGVAEGDDGVEHGDAAAEPVGEEVDDDADAVANHESPEPRVQQDASDGEGCGGALLHGELSECPKQGRECHCSHEEEGADHFRSSFRVCVRGRR